MNPKILLAFAAGVVAATGVAYFAFSGSRKSEPATVSQVVGTTATPTVAPEKPAPVPVVEPEPQREIEPVSPPTRVPSIKAPERAVRRVKPEATTVPVRQRQLPQAPAETAKVPVPIDAPPAGRPPMPEPPGPPQPADPPVRETLPPSSEVKQAPPAPRKAQTVTIPDGTLLTVRVMETINSDKHMAGDTFSATLAEPVVVDGFVIAERGSRAQGLVVEAVPAGRVKGVAKLTLQLTEFRSADGQTIQVKTAAFARQGENSKKSDAVKVGVGAAIGAAIGAIAGGGKGAGVGAASGGAAGTGVVLATRGKAAEIPVETRIGFRLDQPVTITERLTR